MVDGRDVHYRQRGALRTMILLVGTAYPKGLYNHGFSPF